MSTAPEPLPASARLAWWGTAWLRGSLGPDDLLDAVIGDDVTHVLDGGSLLAGLDRLRSDGATAFGAAFPAEGDPVGLGGPPAFNLLALEAGEAVVAVGAGRGLVPRGVGPTVEWTTHPADRRHLPDVGTADRDLRAALLRAAEELADLDVARWRPEVADLLMDLRHRHRPHAPAGVPDRCVELAGRAAQARDIAALALEDDGGALGLVDAERRRQALLPLARTARHALVAAFSPEAWPPA